MASMQTTNLKSPSGAHYQRRVNVRDIRPLIEDCCGWNRKVWADAIEFGLSQFPERLDGKKVLEIGAGRHSALAPIFSLKGAEVWCSYYHLKREDVENGQLKIITEKYQ